MNYPKNIKSITLTIGISLIFSILSVIYVYNFLPFGITALGQPENGMLGATITTINGSDTLKDSRSVINTNFSNLNTDKLERSDYFGTTTMSGITSLPSLTTIGTIVSGTWNGSVINPAYGGTGSSTLSENMLLLGNGTGAVKVIGLGTTGQFLTSQGAGQPPYWSTAAINLAGDYTWTGVHAFNGTSTTVLYNSASSSVASVGYVVGNCLMAASSSALKVIDNSAESNFNASYTKNKEIQIYASGNVRADFDLKRGGGVSANVYGKIYVNGVAAGTERVTTGTSYTTYSEQINVGAGDLVQLYTYAVDGADTADINNFALYFTISASQSCGTVK